MQAFARADCHRKFLLQYFGQTPEWDKCGTCDRCRDVGQIVVTDSIRASDYQTFSTWPE